MNIQTFGFTIKYIQIFYFSVKLIFEIFEILLNEYSSFWKFDKINI